MPKVIDLPTVTDMGDADYLIMESSGGGTKKINKSNAINKYLSFYPVALTTLSELNTAVTNGSSALYFGADVEVGGVTIPRYSRGFSSNVHNSADGVIMVVDVSRNFYAGFRNGSTWSVRTNKETATSGVVTRTSGGTVTGSTVRVSDKVAHLYMSINPTATAAGGNVFEGTINSAYRPVQDSLGVGYVGGSALVGVVRSAGTITIRVIGDAVAEGASFGITIPYLLP